MHKGFILLIFTLQLQQTAAQYNYVRQSGFDTLYNYVTNSSTYADDLDLLAWKWSWGSMDYFNILNTPFGGINNPYACFYQAPKNVSGYQHPHSGNGYAGFSPHLRNVVDGIAVGSEAREHISQTIKKKLTAGHSYYVKFYAVMADSSVRAVNRLGLAFFDDSLAIYNGTPFLPFLHKKPAIYWDTTKIFNDTLHWHKISGVYKAKGNEQFISISNFHYDSLTIAIPTNIGTVGPTSFASFYYIDDVSIYEVTRSSKSIKKICQGTALKGRNNYKRYEWQNDDSLQTYVPTINGTYTVISYSDTSLVIDSFVVELQTPQSISISGDSICTQGTEVTLIAPPNYASYNWSTGATNQSIIIAPINTTVYTVMVTDEYGCEAIAKKELVVKPKPELSIIVPTLLIKSKTKLWQILNLPNNTILSLYDLLGNEIIQTNNYLNNYDYSNLANAIYIYRLSSSDGIIKSGKIVVLE